MSTNNHTAISNGATNDASTVNTPLGQLDAAMGDVSTLTTTATTLTGAANELSAKIGAADSLDASIDTDGTLKAGAVDNAGVLASDVVETAKIKDSNVTNDKLAADAKVGSLAGLTTTAKSAVVAAINELDLEVGTLSTMTTSPKTSLAGAIGNTVFNTTATTITGALAENGINAQMGRQSRIVVNTSYNAFPGLVKLTNNNLIVVYRKGAYHQPTVAHPSEKGTIVMRKSTDYGKSWSSESTVYSDATYDVRDPQIMKRANGYLVVSFFTYISSTNARSYCVYSADSGSTWSEPTEFEVFGTDGFTACSSPMIEDVSQNLYQAVYGKLTGATYYSAKVVRSTNGPGGPWSVYSTIADGTALGKSYTEPNIVIDQYSQMQAYCRVDADPLTDSKIYVNVSASPYTTWTGNGAAFAGTGSPHVIKASSGNLIVNYRSVDALGDPSSGGYFAQRISLDNRTTWQPERLIAIKESARSMMYASTIELAPGLLGTAFALQKNVPVGSEPTVSSIYFQYQSEASMIAMPSLNVDGLQSDGDILLRSGRLVMMPLSSTLGASWMVPVGGATLYLLPDGGGGFDLKIRFANGTVKTIANDTP